MRIRSMRVAATFGVLWAFAAAMASGAPAGAPRDWGVLREGPAALLQRLQPGAK